MKRTRFVAISTFTLLRYAASPDLDRDAAQDEKKNEKEQPSAPNGA